MADKLNIAEPGKPSRGVDTRQCMRYVAFAAFLFLWFAMIEAGAFRNAPGPWSIVGFCAMGVLANVGILAKSENRR